MAYSEDELREFTQRERGKLAQIQRIREEKEQRRKRERQSRRDQRREQQNRKAAERAKRINPPREPHDERLALSTSRSIERHRDGYRYVSDTLIESQQALEGSN